jgi:hypothetical protein
MLEMNPLPYSGMNAANLKSGEGNPKHSVSISTEKEKCTTQLVSGKMKSDNNLLSKQVSEFTIEGNSQEVGRYVARSSSYFKNKNAVTTINRTGEASKADTVIEKMTTEGNKLGSGGKGRGRNDIVVSQFNSEVNSVAESSGKKSKHVDFCKPTSRENAVQRRSSLASSQAKSKPRQPFSSKHKRTARQGSERT